MYCAEGISTDVSMQPASPGPDNLFLQLEGVDWRGNKLTGVQANWAAECS